MKIISSLNLILLLSIFSCLQSICLAHQPRVLAGEEIDNAEVQYCIPELEAVLQPDGSYVYEEVKSCPPDSVLPIDYDKEAEPSEPSAGEEIDNAEVQYCIPELGPVLQPDGSYVYEEVKSCPPGSVLPVVEDHQKQPSGSRGRRNRRSKRSHKKSKHQK